jgi:predicted nucleotidyltransferase
MNGEFVDRNLPENVERFLRSVVAWAAQRTDVRAVILVGSYARGEATADSDIDLMLLVDHPPAFTADHRWAETLGPVRQAQTEAWGKVTSLRVWYSKGLEVEFGITAPDWSRPPLDAGTARVLRDGYQALFDPRGLLADIDPDCPPQGG